MQEDHWLRGLRAGGSARERAVGSLFDHYALRFLAFFRHQGLNHADAEDVLQETFVNIVRGADGFRGDSGVNAWVWTVARNSLLTFFRRRRPDSIDLDDIPAPPAVDGDPADDQVAMQDCVREAYQAFARDHGEHAQGLALSALEGWDTEELSAFLGRSIGATREYLSQCRKRLKPYLERCRDHL